VERQTDGVAVGYRQNGDGGSPGFRRSIAGILLGALWNALMARAGLGESFQASACTRGRRGRPEVWTRRSRRCADAVEDESIAAGVSAQDRQDSEIFK
jgi:hypothetical protein